MKAFQTSIFVAVLLSIVFSSCKDQKVNGPVDFVNTKVGTKRWTKKLQVAGPESPAGITCPYVGPPFAMTKWTPQNELQNVPYLLSNKINGFRASHFPSGTATVIKDYASMTFMPGTGKVLINPEQRMSEIDSPTEIYTPYYYSVYLKKYQIKTEIASTSLCGMLRFTFENADSAWLVIDFIKEGGFFEIGVDNKTIKVKSIAKGFGTPVNFAGYYYISFDNPFESAKIIYTDSVNKKLAALCLKFTPEKGKVVQAKTGSSFIDFEQAEKNLTIEIPDWDFQNVVDITRSNWNKELSKIEIETSDENRKYIFYTAMYHLLQMPREFSEHGRYYSPFDGNVHKGVSYTDYSIWDTFRGVHPMFVLLYPDRAADMITSLLHAYDEGGWMPKWPNPGYSSSMMGTHADAIVADAVAKGIKGFDLEKAYKAMLKNANVPGDSIYQARLGVLDLINIGFVPADHFDESVAQTMENSYDDYCVAQVAKAMGKTEDYNLYIQRSGNYRNLFDSKTKLIGARFSDGTRVDTNAKWISFWAGETERSLKVYKYNYSLFVPHDVSGLINIQGGNEKLSAMLDTFFNKEYYYIGDEFSMHAPYLYNYIGKPWKTQKLLHDLLDFYFTNTPDGLCGNDDCGQLSVWYMFGTIGIYPVCPGNPVYAISSPFYDKTTFNLPGSKKFIITASNLTAENSYIQSATLNGKPYNKSYLNHKDIIDGGELVLTMGNKPSSTWGTATNDCPVQAIPESKKLTMPVLQKGQLRFKGHTEIVLKSDISDATIYYTLDGSEPNEHSLLYDKHLVIDKTCVLKVRLIKPGYEAGYILTLNFIKHSPDFKLTLHFPFDAQYSAGGNDALVDGCRGGLEYNSGQWQAFRKDGLHATIDMGNIQIVKELKLRFLRNFYRGALIPTQIKIMGSVDNKIFYELNKFSHNNEEQPRTLAYYIKEYTTEINKPLRYIRVDADCPVKCPAWLGRDKLSPMIMCDEIEFKSVRL